MNELKNKDKEALPEGVIRTMGLHPAADRLKVGLNAIVGRPDGSVVKLRPDGTEEVLHPPEEQQRESAKSKAT